MSDPVRRLHQAVAAACPLDGIAVLDPAARAVRVDYRAGATDQQRAAAQAVIDAFDWSDAAQAAWDADQHPERKSLRQAASQAVADNDTFLALASPTNAQVLAQVKALTRQNSRIIARLTQID